MKLGFRPTIGAKLILLIALLLMGSIASLVSIANGLFTRDNLALIQQMNADTALSLASQMREILTGLAERTRFAGVIMMREATNGANRDALLKECFGQDRDFIAIFLHEHVAGAPPRLLATSLSDDLLASGDKDGTVTLSTLARDPHFSWPRAVEGEVQVAPLRLNEGSTALAIVLPFVKSTAPGSKNFSHTLTAVFRQSRFGKVVSESDISVNFVVDRFGRYLAHPDASLIAEGAGATHLEIVRQLLEGSFNNGQTRYFDPASDEAKLGAFRQIGFAGIAVVTEVPEAKAFAAARRVAYRSLLVAVVVLSLAFLAGYFFSGSITWPLERLVWAVRKIAEGDFTIRIQPRSRDEVAELSLAFNEMAEGLEERELVKATFAKFHNKEIAHMLLSGEVKLGGERREATIFFSDIRGFTSLSEVLQPEEVVEMLNEYMTCMVSVIRKHGGIVDKYVGDAIMAVWGIPLGMPDDTERAVRAALEMREALVTLNQKRVARKQPELRIGMGLNTGTVIAGNIGSDEKMEYTVIGDAVNLASRIESITKELKTDLLVTQSVKERIGDKFVFASRGEFQVKGKSLALEVFEVASLGTAAGLSRSEDAMAAKAPVGVVELELPPPPAPIAFAPAANAGDELSVRTMEGDPADEAVLEEASSENMALGELDDRLDRDDESITNVDSEVPLVSGDRELAEIGDELVIESETTQVADLADFAEVGDGKKKAA